jgi:hypothetical protein
MIDERDALLCACNLMVERHTSVEAYVTGTMLASFQVNVTCFSDLFVHRLGLRRVLSTLF